MEMGWWVVALVHLDHDAIETAEFRSSGDLGEQVGDLVFECLEVGFYLVERVRSPAPERRAILNTSIGRSLTSLTGRPGRSAATADGVHRALPFRPIASAIGPSRDGPENMP